MKMKVDNLSLSGVWIGTPSTFSDERGIFFEWFKKDIFSEQTSFCFNLLQANCSISRKGVIRGIHFAKNPPGQAKYVTCLSGEVFDVVVDLRPESPTFGKWESILLKSTEPKIVYIPSGIGHGFMSLEENSVFVYLCDQKYNPENEFDINPFDKDLGIDWPSKSEIVLSEKDKLAPSFSEVSEKILKTKAK